MKLEDYITPWLIRGLRVFVAKYARAKEDIEDIVQTSLLKACMNFDKYNPKYKFTTWIYTIASHEAYNMRIQLRGLWGPRTHRPIDEAKLYHPLYIDYPARNFKTGMIEEFDVHSTHPENGYIAWLDRNKT